MKTSIFIRSYAKDFHWLAYCLRSIQKFATGFSEIVIACPESDAPLLSHLTEERVIPVHNGPPFYLQQQVDKLKADLHTRADYIVHVDSDMIFTRPVSPADYMRDGNPIWVVTPFMDKEMRAWMHVMVKCFHKMPPYEFMRKCSIIAPGWIYEEFRKFIQEYHGISMEAYVMNQPGNEFSEYNCLGFFAWLNFKDKFYWHDTEKEGADWPFKQYWSYSGMTPGERQEIENYLA